MIYRKLNKLNEKEFGKIMFMLWYRANSKVILTSVL